MRGSRPAEILLVEDNPSDVRLTREALREAAFNANLSVAIDGDEALNFLLRQGKHAAAVTPDLVLLDLNLPKRDGREVLAIIKADPRLRRIPVVVLTTSGATEDVETTYDLHVNCYIKKPDDIDAFVGVIKAIDLFWFGVVTLPDAHSSTK